jgi:hypothetical protein
MKSIVFPVMNTESPDQRGDVDQPDAMRHDRDSEKSIASDLGRSPEETKIEDSPPDGGIGWLFVACVAVINAHTWGLNSVSHNSIYVSFQNLLFI